MHDHATRIAIRLDATGLFAAGLINTFMAMFVAGIILGPGTMSRQPDLLLRAGWIADHMLRWQLGWLFWFAVTLSFSWSYYAIGRHLAGPRPWRSLATGLAVIAAGVDIGGVLVYLVVLPEVAQAPLEPAMYVLFQAMENLAYAATNVTAFGLYSLAGLLLLPALFATADYPRWMAWLGTVEWGIAAMATVLLVAVPSIAVGPLMISFLLYAPWVWASGFWLLRKRAVDQGTEDND